MAAKRAAAKGSLDSQDFDAEFEKFMNEVRHATFFVLSFPPQVTAMKIKAATS